MCAFGDVERGEGRVSTIANQGRHGKRERERVNAAGRANIEIVEEICSYHPTESKPAECQCSCNPEQFGHLPSSNGRYTIYGSFVVSKKRNALWVGSKHGASMVKVESVA